MAPVTYYGIICDNKSEKVLLSRVNEYLKTLNRSTSKVKDGSMLEEDGFKIKYFYWNLNKDAGTWMDLKPNEDLVGKWRFSENKECGWIMHVRVNTSQFPDSTTAKAEGFINSLLQATRFEYKILKEDIVY
jgi:hypothetical protein